jgi:PST family polysaccharide transporter
VAWSSAGTFATLGSGALTIVVLSRLIEPEAFGFIAAATAVGVIIRAVGPMAIVQATIQEGDRPGILRAAASAAWLFGLLAGGLLVVSAPWLASVFGLPDEAWVFRAWALVLAFQCASVPAQASLQRALRFKQLTAIQAASALGSALVALALALTGHELLALFAGVVVQAGVELVGNIVAMRRLVLPERGGETWRIARRSTTFSATFAASATANQGDKMVVGGFLGAEAFGLYSRAFRLMSFPATIFGDAVETVLFPVSVRVRDDLGVIYRGLVVGVHLLALVLVPVSAVAAVIAEPFVELALGPQWGGAVPAFRILCLGMFFRVAQKLFDATLRGLGHQAQLARILTVYAAAVVLFSLVGQRSGIEGVAFGVVLALLVNNVISGLAVVRRLDESPADLIAKVAMALPVALASAAAAAASESVLEGGGPFVRVLVGSAVGCIPIAAALLVPPYRRSVRTLMRMRHGQDAGPASVPSAGTDR